jgi:hypothetical protein
VSFAQKNIQVQFSIASGSFGGGGNNLTLGSSGNGTNGMRITCEVHQVPGTAGSMLDELVIYGMSLSHMNQLSVIGKQLYAGFQQNSVTISTSDGDQNQGVLFQGIINQAYIDGRDQPNVRFVVSAQPQTVAARKPMQPTTHKGAYPAQQIAQQLAQAMGFQFENSNGFQAMLRNPYLWGTGISQIRQLSKAANFVWGIDGARNTLAIWPKGGARQVGSPPLISPQTSGPGKLVGYPIFNGQRIYATCYYGPSLWPWTTFEVQSSITAANGTWQMAQMDVSLDSWTPHGRWFATLIGDSGNNVASSGTQ